MENEAQAITQKFLLDQLTTMQSSASSGAAALAHSKVPNESLSIINVVDSSGSGDGDESDPEIGGLREKFHNTVRENIIFLLFFLTLFIISWLIICRFIKKRESDSEDSDEAERIIKNKSEESAAAASGAPGNGNHSATVSVAPATPKISADDDESLVYRICFWICVFSLSISIGGTLLLPISIVSNEVLLLYPKSYYVQWLNGMLVQGLWNLIFLFANISLFILLPFAYFFIESEGFSGNKKGILPKVYETIVILALAGFTVVCIAYVLALLLSPDESKTGMSGLFILGFIHQLPFIYSCISFLGVLLLLVSTPLGFARLFTVLSQLLVGPQFIRNLDEEILVLQFEIDSIQNSIQSQAQCLSKIHTGFEALLLQEKRKNQSQQKFSSHFKKQNYREREREEESISCISELGLKVLKMKTLTPLQESTFTNIKELEEKLVGLRKQLITLEKMSRTPGWKRNLLYPILLLIVLILTALAVVMVTLNTLQLLVGLKALPVGPATEVATSVQETLSLGLKSMSILGPSGAALEVIVIFYLIFTSLVGLYMLPGIRNIRPQWGNTPTSNIIYNCTLLLITSSALPLLVKILGITNFDLLGNYGKIQWLGSFYLVVAYNIGFSVANSLCLINKFTLTVRQEILKRLKIVFNIHKIRIPFIHRGENLGQLSTPLRKCIPGGSSSSSSSNYLDGSFSEDGSGTVANGSKNKKTE